MVIICNYYSSYNSSYENPLKYIKKSKVFVINKNIFVKNETKLPKMSCIPEKKLQADWQR